MNALWVWTVGGAYLAVLFWVARRAEAQPERTFNGRRGSWLYALSLGVYATAWTYYGSVGRAATRGLDFVTIYLGPTLAFVLLWPTLQKMVRVSKNLRLTSLADFIATRYGKSLALGVAVTLLSIVGLVPYIALQIKAVVESTQILLPHVAEKSSAWFAAGTTVVLGFFSIVYGARRVDPDEKHPGLITALALDSVLKLVAFLVVGVFAVWVVFSGPEDLWNQAQSHPKTKNLFTLNGQGAYLEWTALTVLSLLAVFLLPRQFHTAVVENRSEDHLNQASWRFPLYLWLINLFVLPIAAVGLMVLPSSAVPDDFVLALPLAWNQSALAVFVWLGGLSAATGMMVVETVALSTMVSNHLVLPLWLGRTQSGSSKSIDRQGREELWGPRILTIRRASMLVVLGLALAYYWTLGRNESLVSIGLVSFCAVAQFAPATFGALYWKGGNRKGALAGMLAGFSLWVYTLILPILTDHGFLPDDWLNNGPWGLTFLKPFALLGLDGWDHIVHALWWSLLANTLLYVGLSQNTTSTSEERLQAELFADVPVDWRASGETYAHARISLGQLLHLLGQFVGTDRAQNLINGYAKRHRIDTQTPFANPVLIAFTERILSGVVGSASAQMAMRTVVDSRPLSSEDLLDLLQENRTMVALNKDLSRAKEQLQAALQTMRENDERKDEFLYTVTHELRTPLTSIRALAEIIHDHPDLTEEQRLEFTGAITTETERLSHLITQILNLERYSSGRYQIQVESLNWAGVLREAEQRLASLVRTTGKEVRWNVPDRPVSLQADSALLQQVIYNLVSNALKFSKSRVDLRTQTAGELLVWWVDDDGPGVPSGSEEAIFDKFFQAKNQTLRKPEGSGLGLAICKNIVEMHGGHLRVDRSPLNGARFVVTLPRTWN